MRSRGEDKSYKSCNTTSLVVQGLGPCLPLQGGAGSIPGWGTKIPEAAWRGHKNKQTNKKVTLGGGEAEVERRDGEKENLQSPGLDFPSRPEAQVC